MGADYFKVFLLIVFTFGLEIQFLFGLRGSNVFHCFNKL